MVAGEVQGVHVQMLNEQVALLQNLIRGAHLEPAGQHVLPHGGALGGGEGHGGQVAGLHLVDHLGGGQDMLLPVPVLAGETHDDDGPQVKAGGHQFLPRLQHLGGGDPLVDGL